MAEPRRDEGHVALTSRFATTTPLTTTGNGYHQRSTASEPYRMSTPVPYEHEIEQMPPVTGYNPRNETQAYMNDINHRPDGNNPIPKAKENAAPTTDELFAKATKRLRYDKSTPMPTIYKVPDELKGGVHDHKDYCPVAVYLGGFVRPRYERSWFNLEEYKWCCVRQLIERRGFLMDGTDNNARELLQSCMNGMHFLLPQVVASYSQDIEIVNNNEMAERMLLDGCLILHRLLRHAYSAINGNSNGKNDDWTQTFGRSWVWESVTRDMLLLENQIPLFIVKRLFELLKNKDESEELLFTGSRGLFRSMRLEMRVLRDIERKNVHHLLHLFYMSVGFPQESKPNKSNDDDEDERDVFLPDLMQWVPSAKELEEAGVKFCVSNPTSFLRISFDDHKGVLEIPQLQLYDSSSALFRNLIAFEQTYPETKCAVSTYALFMDCLINTPEDMRILHLRGIIVSHMSGEQDAGRFFSQISTQVHIPADNYLVDLMNKVSEYKDSKQHKWRAALMQNYFKNPWMAMSVFAAVLLLALTVLQTFFTVYPYYRPGKHT